MWIKGLLSVAFLFVCIILILTVLIQRPSGGGLSGAFGSASGSGQTAFGAKTGDALTIFTIIMFVVFVLGGIGMKFVTAPQQGPAPAGLTSGSGAPAPAPGAGQTPEAPEPESAEPGDTGPGTGELEGGAQPPAGEPGEPAGDPPPTGGG